MRGDCMGKTKKGYEPIFKKPIEITKEETSIFTVKGKRKKK